MGGLCKARSHILRDYKIPNTLCQERDSEIAADSSSHWANVILPSSSLRDTWGSPHKWLLEELSLLVARSQGMMYLHSHAILR